MQLSNRDRAAFIACLRAANEAAFQGWDFSYMDQYGGNPGEPFEWSYEKTVRETAGKAASVLDMGTGGGEFFAALGPFAGDAYATESYPPNLPVAKKRLEPLGVKVIGLEGGKQEDCPTPFEDAFFDLVLNRHESYESRDVYRTLKSGGTFITQQVGNSNLESLRIHLGSLDAEEDLPWNLDTCKRFLIGAGFQIIRAKEHSGLSRFYDIRSLVYLLKAIPWEFPNFDPFKCQDQLLDIHIKILQDGYFDSTEHRFFVIAKKVR
ncbi:MAG: class I SAM-dependent methyltransferase [Anaerolineaceae bacterium]|nr:class I SAM-dependent methyltransferase [Anaerolineaceae bacterium]